jgi:hypothetical protein
LPELNEGQDEALMAVAAGDDADAAVVTEELRPGAAGYEDPYTQADVEAVAADDVVVSVDPSPRRTWADPNAATASGDRRTYANSQQLPQNIRVHTNWIGKPFKGSQTQNTKDCSDCDHVVVVICLYCYRLRKE